MAVGPRSLLVRLWVLGLLFGVWTPRVGWANPDIRWRTLETEHFYIHYWKGNEEVADRAAMIGEKAYDELTRALGHEVFLKTHVTITDHEDDANGFATARPFPALTIYTTSPASMSVLESFDDWVDIVLTHELVHVVHIDTVHGVHRAINAIFGFGVLGKVSAPNLNLPRWIVEGIATMFESKLSTRGRGRSAQFDAFLRMSVLDGRFPTLDQVSSGARIWPHGSSVYLYGLHFMRYISDRFGERAIRDLSHVYARQLVPFGINRAIQAATGLTFYELWRDFRRDVEIRMTAQAREIRRHGLRQGRRLTFSGETTRYPVWGPGDRDIYFYGEDEHRREGIKRIAARGGRMREGAGIGRQGVDLDVEHVFDVEGPARASFVGVTGDMVFDLEGVFDFRYVWRDLHRWNGGDPLKDEQLTFGARAFEPDVSPDGRVVAFRRNDMAQSRLAFVALDTADVEEVPPLGKVAQVYSPRFAPDGHRVAFSGWRDGGYRDIYVYDRDDATTRRITADRFLDGAPAWTPDGRFVLFTSDRNGVSNIYAYDFDTERVWQVSNVLGGAFEPAVSRDGTKIAYVGYSGVGFDLWVMDLDREMWLVPPPTIDPFPPSEDPKPGAEDFGPGRPTAKSHRYRPIMTMYPRTIFPTALDFQSSQFGTGLGFETGIADVLGFHSLGIAVNYDFRRRIWTGSVSYLYTRLWPDFSLYASRNVADRGSFVRYDYEREPPDEGSYVQQGYREAIWRLGVSTALPIVRRRRHVATLEVGYAWTRFVNLDDDDIVIDPNAPAIRPPPVGDAAQVALTAVYSNERDGDGRFTFGVERGRRASVAVGVFDEVLGSDFSDVQVSARYREIIAMPWRGHSSLALEARGGASVGASRAASTFCVGDYLTTGDTLRRLLARQSTPTGCSGHVRGYPSDVRRGRHFAVGSAEFRAPLLDIDRGLGTLPVFLSRLGAVGFFDVGNAWDASEAASDVLMGLGAALVVGFRLGYLESINLLVQYAHGFHAELGVDSLRAVVSTSF